MAFAPSKGKKHYEKSKGAGRLALNMTSIIDMFTVLLAFMLKSFSAEGALVTQAKGLELPKSIAAERPKPGLTIAIGQAQILIENNPVANTAEFTKADYEKLSATTMYADIQKRHEAALNMEKFGTKFTGEAIIQGDKDVPFGALFKVMYVCARNGYDKMRLIVVSKSE